MRQENESALLALRRLFMRRSDYRKVFCDEKGNLKPEAQTVFADWIKLSRYNDSPLVVTDGKTDIPGTFSVIGMQSLVKRTMLMCRLDDSDLAEAEKNMRTIEANMIGVRNG